MKKALLTAFLLAVIICGFLGSAQVSLVQAGVVSGIISSDTTWTRANSPYSFVGDVTVAEGVTLTIEEEVKVDFTQTVPSTDWVGRPSETIICHNLQVDGTLLADGNTFSTKYGTLINFSQSSKGSKIENAFFSGGYKISTSGSSPEFRSNSFAGFSVVITVNGGSPIINSNHFAGLDMAPNILITVDGGSAEISNNTIDTDTKAGAFVFLTGANTAVVSDNQVSGIFSDSAIIVSSGSPLFERNFISDHNDEIWPMKSVGMTIYGNSSPVVRSNTIANNKIGLNVYDSDGSPSLTLAGNNFEQNSQYNIYLGQEAVYGTTAPDIDAVNNWWGTTDTSVISQSIFDHKNNNNLGTVTFDPILVSRNPSATPNTSPSPSASPSPTQQPTTEPTQTASPTVVVEGVSNPLPLALSIIAVVISLVTLGMLVYSKKHNKNK